MLGLRLTIAALALSAPGLAAAQDGAAMRRMMKELGADTLSGKKLDRAIAKAKEHPFGGDKNPVRANGPQGQRAYLRRLRCADNTAPQFERAGSTGIGPYGTILDLYSVQCGDAPAAKVYMDMYHEHIEAAPVPGFAIVPPEGEQPV
ncbi:MAG TPA: hypothetical protein VLG14_14810 [Sphingomonas sp.]|nr:hypothetical protein [Sphingomonas sp.]